MSVHNKQQRSHLALFLGACQMGLCRACASADTVCVCPSADQPDLPVLSCSLQVVSTVATLSKTTSSLSRDAKEKMVNVCKAGVAAAKLSRTPIAPEAGSRLLAVLAAGKGVSAACKLPNGCKQAAAVVPAASRHLLSEVGMECRQKTSLWWRWGCLIMLLVVVCRKPALACLAAAAAA